jgi:hypothetical protein
VQNDFFEARKRKFGGYSEFDESISQALGAAYNVDKVIYYKHGREPK